MLQHISEFYSKGNTDGSKVEWGGNAVIYNSEIFIAV